jgi:hypothetical protein
MNMATALAIVSLLVLPGCAQHIRPFKVIPASSSSEDDLLSKLRHLYPDRFTMSHRVILTVRGKSYDFNGYLNRNGDHFSAVGFSDPGGRLFHIASSPQNVEVFLKPERMPANVLRNHVIPELNAIFAGISPASVSQDRNGNIVLMHGSRKIEYIFNPAHELCHTIIMYEDGEKISFIELRDYRIFTGWSRDIPQTIRVSNRKWNYEMVLRLLQIKSS